MQMRCLGIYRVKIVFVKIRLPAQFLLGRSDAHVYWTLACEKKSIFLKVFPSSLGSERKGVFSGFIDISGNWMDLPESFARYTKQRRASEVFLIGLGDHFIVILPSDYQILFPKKKSYDYVRRNLM